MTPPHQDPTLFNTLKAFLNGLPSPQPPYCLIEGLAQGVWGTIRATQDIDFLMALNDENRGSTIAALASCGFELDSRWAESNPMLQGIVTRFRHGPYPVDMWEPRDAHEQESLGRRRLIPLDMFSVWVASAEDMILLKLKASRDQDFVDVVQIISQQEKALQLDYLWSWADRLGLEDELSYVLKSATSSQ